MIDILKSIFVLWACNSLGWDHDFMRELFPSPKFEHINYPDFLQLNETSRMEMKPRVIVYNIENSGHDAQYTVITDLIKQYKPQILVHTSDEFQGWGQKWKYGEGTNFYNQVPLVLRQYGIWPYRSLQNLHVVQLPLGYMTGMLVEGNRSMSSIEAATYSLTRSSSNRNYSWSFIGNQNSHKERKYGVEVFSEWHPNYIDGGLPPPKMKEIYNNSKLVLVGRGHVNLDCYRVYEAIISGAIPVVVGPKFESDLAFEFEGDLPPLIFADSFQSALQICKNLTDSDIDKLRSDNINWYINRMKYIMKKIDFTLSVFH